MRKLVVVLMLLVASTSFAAPQEVRFEPVAVAEHEFVGSYGGPDATYGLVLERANGRLHGTYVEHGRLAVLSPVEVHGAEFTATANFDDGSYRVISGTFARRSGGAFGARLAVPSDAGMVEAFFEKL